LIVILSLIVLAVGVLVSVLYRIPGALFFATLMGSVTLTMFILVFSGKIISLAVILGVIAGVILSVASLFSVMQRMKKHISKEDFVLNGAKKGALKGI
jgi:SecD/SecF fusion protein